MALNYVEKNNNKNTEQLFSKRYLQSLTKSNNFCNNVSAIFACKRSFSREFFTVYLEDIH